LKPEAVSPLPGSTPDFAGQADHRKGRRTSVKNQAGCTVLIHAAPGFVFGPYPVSRDQLPSLQSHAGHQPA